MSQPQFSADGIFHIFSSYEPITKKASVANALLIIFLDSTLDFTGAQASAADIKSLRGAINNHPYFLQIRFPSSFGADVGVTDFHSGAGCFTADLTYGHDDTSFAKIESQLLKYDTKYL